MVNCKFVVVGNVGVHTADGVDRGEQSKLTKTTTSVCMHELRVRVVCSSETARVGKACFLRRRAAACKIAAGAKSPQHTFAKWQ
jgi:hypothetical protein